jgi:pSer/pThr/pTyr-binding forkhead associated (FHA) protein
MKKSSIADIVETTIDFLERSGADKLAQHYLNFALSTFASGCQEQLAHYMVRYDVQGQRLSAESAQLLVVGEKEDVEFILDSYANLIGRVDPETRSYPNIDLTAYDPHAKISRRHAKIYSMDGRNYWLEDLGSFNGTSLNGVRIGPRQPQPIHDGDDILFGNTAVIFRSPATSKSAREQSNKNQVSGLI